MSVAVEFWGVGLGGPAAPRPNRLDNNTYKGLRVEAEDYGFYYSVWCNNVREMYDMKVRMPSSQYFIAIANRD